MLFWWSIRHEHMKVAFTPAAARRATIRFGIGNVGYVAAIGIAFASATASLLISGLVAIYYIFEQTPARETAAATAESLPGTGPQDG